MMTGLAGQLRFAAVAVAVTGLCSPFTRAADLSQDEPPYPRSEVITDIAFGSYEKYTPDRAGDNWPITWADDGHQYTAWGDGRGPDHPDAERVSMGFARVVGDPPDVEVVKIDSPDEQSGDGRRGRKASGMLMVDGVLYMWVRNDNQQGEHCRLWWSTDRGENWTRADWNFEEVGYLTFVNFGRDYEDARDEYVYSVSHDTPSAYDFADDFILMRVPRDDLATRSEYEFFKGLTGEGDPIWTSAMAERGSVFHHAGRCQRSSISYNAELERYLWWQSGWPNLEGEDSRFHDSLLGIYEAPEPWGPWRTVFHSETFPSPGETGCFPTKWMGPVMNGQQTVHMLTSTDDAFSVYPVTLTIRD